MPPYTSQPIGKRAPRQETFSSRAPLGEHAAPERAVREYTVSELAGELKGNLERNFFWICVRGEVSSVSAASSGHIYFTLKDAQAQISCAWFSGSIRSVGSCIDYDRRTGEKIFLQNPASVFSRDVRADELRKGLACLCYGKISFYGFRGTCQLIVERIEHDGAGLLALEFEKRKRELEARGYFDRARKRPLPDHPTRVALVTSETGAAIHDFCTISATRGLSATIRLFPTLVQGKGAAEEIASAIHLACEQGWAQVVVVIRGGGSLEDLWCFNEMIVADAIFYAAVPVVAGIGHEIDWTLADMTADVRAITPTHAAELLWKPRSEYLAGLAQARERLFRNVEAFLAKRSQLLDHEERALRMGSPANRLSSQCERWLMSTRMFMGVFMAFLAEKERRLAREEGRLREFLSRERLEKQSGQLDLLLQTVLQSVWRSLAGRDLELGASAARLHRTMQERLQERERELAREESRLREFMTRERLEQKEGQLDLLLQSMLQSVWKMLAKMDMEQSNSEAGLRHGIRVRLDEYAAKLSTSTALLQSVSPLALLERGYALVEDEEGHIVRSVDAVEKGATVLISLQDGRVSALVTGKEKDGVQAQQ